MVEITTGINGLFSACFVKFAKQSDYQAFTRITIFQHSEIKNPHLKKHPFTVVNLFS
jgi:hypothetical protein